MALECPIMGCPDCVFLDLRRDDTGGGICRSLGEDVSEYCKGDSENLYHPDCSIKKYGGILVIFEENEKE